MRYTVTKQRLQIVGTLWMGGTAATIRDLSSYDLDNIEDVKDRDSVQSWIDKNVGDFQSVTDFRADFHIGDENVVHEWKNSESEMMYSDCMYPEEG